MKRILTFLLLIWVISAMPLHCIAQQTNQPPSNTNSLSHSDQNLIRLMRKKLQKDSSHLSTEERTRREISISLFEVPECHDYLEQISSKISKAISDCDSSSSPHDTMIDAKFVLHLDGSISDITISGNTNALVVQCVVLAIKNSSTTQKWPEKMRAIVGKDSFEWGHHFGFNMTPPPAD